MIAVKRKKQKEQINVIKQGLKFENYTDRLFNNKIVLKSQLRFKIDHHNVYTIGISKIALSSNDNKRLQTLNNYQRSLKVNLNA